MTVGLALYVRGSRSTYKGRIEGMNGHIYDVPSSGNNNQFDETTKELANFIGSSMLFKDSGGAVCKAVGQLGLYEIPLPAALDAAVTDGSKSASTSLNASR
jgi:hypothetical protein